MSTTADEKNNIYKGGHVFYFEPNDADVTGKDQDGQDVSLMPHLEDLCISMTLTADMYSRKRAQMPKLENGDRKAIFSRSLSWISYVNGIDTKNEVNKQIINAGVKMGDSNYLTTYYTEISADNYIENELVEGLGVTSVNIAYESWYTPTITINFVDVHGASLWGREEAIHDKDGNITTDTLLGVFFQQPYPLFRLQIKGFLGREVTYQLSVSSFKGRYNSQTGNFEATATFIGYSYSLLTDIPIKLLAYVSEMSYVGKQYWDEHCNTKEWQLIDANGNTRPPVKLYQFIQDIQSAVKSLNARNAKDCDGNPIDTTFTDMLNDSTSENRIVSLAESRNVSNALNSKSELNKIETALNAFIKECKTFAESTHGGKMIVGKDVNSNNKSYNEQILLVMANTKGSIPFIKPYNAYKTFVKAVKNYNKKNPENQFEDCLASQNSETFGEFNKISLEEPKITTVQIFKIAYSEDGTWASSSTQPQQIYGNGGFNINNPKDATIGKIKLYNDTAEQLKELVNSVGNSKDKPTKNGYGIGEYAYGFYLGDMRSVIEKLKKKIKAVGTNTENRIESKVASRSNSNEKVNESSSNSSEDEALEKAINLHIADLVGFEPTIGNFVKMVMCHLETFIEVMMHCADQIYVDMDKRTPSNFGISLDNTDIPYGDKEDGKQDGVIFPWPALYNPNAKENDETSAASNGKYEMLGWPNDYKPKEDGLQWEEEKVILSALDAIQRYEQKGNSRTDSVIKYACLPISGGDLATPSPFVEVAPYCKDIETLAPYLGLRIANLIGVGDYNCSQSDAEAIGYMDALNLIGAASNYKKLKDAVTSTVTEQDFATQVINYLTCSNKSKSTSESDRGKQYNLFEFLKENENLYNTDRHPMFAKVGDLYIYSYTYANSTDKKKIVSIVPTELHRFTGTNSPYLNRVFDKIKCNIGENKVAFAPRYKETGSSTGVCQWFNYIANSEKLIAVSTQPDYTNEQLFSVMVKKSSVKALLQQVNALKNGEVKFKDYQVKNDETLKSFINRRFKTSLTDYYSIFCNGDKLLMPLISKVDETYYNEHLCNSADEASTVKMNDDWSAKTSSALNKKLSLSVKEAGTSFKNGKTEYSLSDVMVGEIPIMTNNEAKCSLFGSRLYYQQNDIEDEGYRKKAKAYLLLSAMMDGVDISSAKFRNGIFQTDICSLIDLLPPFYVYFIGALLWRKCCNKEPLNLANFVAPKQEESFISNTKKIFYLQTNGKCSWYKLSDYYMSYDKIDLSVANKLINLFEEFANSQIFQNIINAYELKTTDGNFIDSNMWNTLKTKWSVKGFDASSPTQWENIFSNIYGNYSSITIPSGCNQTLRLLMTESNDANASLKDLYGITNCFIVGRGTKTRVGQSEESIVKVKQYQMMGYLKGFERRIKDIKNTSDTTIKQEITISKDDVNRDIAISYYYSLKQLWDSWLISCARDQFTIQNFFNKYFIFMDSFYVNTYKSIKLNCQTILDAFNSSNENVSLLTFITHVTSQARCMFFALPTFMDSNIMTNNNSNVGSYDNDMSYKKSNLRSIFRPYSFNEMDAPKPNNVFVFVYTQPYSSNAAENTDKRFDSYMMNDQSTWPSVLNGNELPQREEGALSANSNNRFADDDDELISARYAYSMPCFGVAVNRGNNYIFKSINVNMDSPQVTAVSAQTWENILTKSGKDGAKRVFFHGQDIFNIYSQYAYSCEIEMLGCAQIQPLMYFQLLNIPMWRGTYMIYKVTHSLQPGTMYTKFTGVKMSRTQAPLATGYFTIPKKNANSDKSNNGSSNGGNNGGYTNAVGGEEMVKAIFGNYTNYKISNNYDEYRGPSKKTGKPHYHCGIDIFGAKGTPLYAPWDGTVKWTRTGSDTAGNYLMFADTNNKYAVIFMHCDELKVVSGQSVKYGEVLATLGQTGGSATKNGKIKPHLHLELYINGEFTTGESIRHNGPGQHVNPLGKYGSTSSNNDAAYNDVDYSNSSDSTLSTDKSKQSLQKKHSWIYTVGDDWSKGVSTTKVLENGCGRNNAQLVTVKNVITSEAIKYWKKQAKSFVVCCGINDLGTLSSLRVEYYKTIITKLRSTGKTCYICTFPNLPAAHFDIQSLNADIKSAASACGIKVIKIPDSIMTNNLSTDGYHLKNWKPLAEYILQNAK